MVNEMISKFPGTCKCGQQVAVGQAITYDPDAEKGKKVIACPSCKGNPGKQTQQQQVQQQTDWAKPNATPSVDDLGKFAQRETEHIAVILGVVRGVFENEIQANMVTKIIYQEWCRSHGGSR